MRHAVTIALLLGAFAWAQQPQPLTLRTRIALGSVHGRIDHLAADIAGQRLFVAALGNHTVEVLDVKSGRRIHAIPDLDEPQGVFYDPSANHLFVACAKDGATRIFDARTFQLLQTVKLSADADNIRYAARDRRIIVGYGDGALAFLDPNGAKTVEIPLGGHPESFQLEEKGTRIFVNVPDRKQIEVADRVKLSVIAKWPVTSALKNYPMALDESRHRLFVGCRQPARMLVLDTADGRQVASLAIAGDTDDLFYDQANARIYVIGGEGFLDVLQHRGGDRYDRLQRIATAPGARTGLFVPAWRSLFIAVPRRGAQVSEVLAYEPR